MWFNKRPSTHQEPADWAQGQLSFEASRLAVFTVLKHLSKWLEVHVDESTTVQERQPKYASLQKALLTCFNDIKVRCAVVSGAMFIEKEKL